MTQKLFEALLGSGVVRNRILRTARVHWAKPLFASSDFIINVKEDGVQP